MNAHATAEFFADRLSRLRALTPDETDRLCAVMGDRRKLWSHDDDQRLARMRRDGLNAPEIARAMGRSPWAVRSRAAKLKRKETGCG